MRIVVITLIAILSLYACRKADRNEDSDTSMATDFADVENAMSEIFYSVNEACKSTSGIKAFVSCATLTADTLGNPKNLVVDFGNTGCVSPSGRNRFGKIVVYLNNAFSAAGTFTNVYFDSLYINGYNFAGNLKITTTTTGYQIQANNFKLIYPDTSAFLLLNGLHYFVQSSGASTAIADDDMYNVSGTLNLIGSKGGTHTCIINAASPLQLNGNCAYISGGELEIQPMGLVPRPLDFGSGGCDNSFIISINGGNQSLNSGF